MYCSQCGRQNAAGAINCAHCGQPMRAPAQPVAGSVSISNHLVWAILATMFCCLPTGIVAIVYAAQVDGKLAAGDIEGALRMSSNAATWSWVSFGLGMLFVLCYFGLVFLGAVAGR